MTRMTTKPTYSSDVVVEEPTTPPATYEDSQLCRSSNTVHSDSSVESEYQSSKDSSDTSLRAQFGSLPSDRSSEAARESVHDRVLHRNREYLRSRNRSGNVRVPSSQGDNSAGSSAANPAMAPHPSRVPQGPGASDESIQDTNDLVKLLRAIDKKMDDLHADLDSARKMRDTILDDVIGHVAEVQSDGVFKSKVVRGPFQIPKIDELGTHNHDCW